MNAGKVTELGGKDENNQIKNWAALSHLLAAKHSPNTSGMSVWVGGSRFAQLGHSHGDSN